MSTENSNQNEIPAKPRRGPRTAAGKTKVSKNAVKHGLLARPMVIHGEKASDYAQLVAGFIDSWRPETAYESELVELLAERHWQLRRCIRHEHQLFLDSNLPGRTPKRERIDLPAAQIDEMRELENELGMLTALLELELDSTVPDGLLDELLEYYDVNPGGPGWLQHAMPHYVIDGRLRGIDAESLLLFIKDAQGEDQDDQSGRQIVEDDLSQIQAGIDDLREYEDALHPTYEEVPTKRKRRRRIDLPSDEELGKLIRYRTGIERSIARLLIQLEQARSMRQMQANYLPALSRALPGPESTT